MKREITTIVLMSIIIASFTPTIEAYLIPMNRIELYLQHDLILFGEVFSLNEFTESDTPMTSYNVKILYLIKGEYRENQINAIGLGTSNSTKHLDLETILVEGQKGMFMLNKQENGIWMISPYSNFSELVDPDLYFILPPLKLSKSGVPNHEIHCKTDLKFALKTSNNDPVCLTEESFDRLLKRGWIK